MTVIPVGFAQANLLFGGVAQPNGAQVTLGLDIPTGTLTPGDVAALVVSNVETNLMDQMANSTTFLLCLVKFGPTTTGASAEWPSGMAGSLPGDPAPPNTTYLVRKNTASGGRAGRGRMYLPGCTDPDVLQGGTLDPARRGGLQTAMNDFFDQLNTDSLGPVLLHGETSPLTTPTPIDSFTVDSVVATQRRRLRG